MFLVLGQMPISTTVDISPAYTTSVTSVRNRRFWPPNSSITLALDGQQRNEGLNRYQGMDDWAIEAPGQFEQAFNVSPQHSHNAASDRMLGRQLMTNKDTRGETFLV